MRVLIGIATLAGVAIVIGLGMLAIAWARAAPQPFPPGSESAGRLAAGPYRVGRADFEWTDGSRTTPPHDDYPGAPQRTLAVTMWYPKGAHGKLPLLVYCHGFTSNRFGGRYLAQHLASHGYVVVAADFPLTNMNAPGGPWVDDVVRQPGDVSFLIDRTLALSKPERPLAADIDGTRIGVLGLSLGAVTATLVGFHPKWRDPRVDAVVSMAGVGDVFGPTFYRHAHVPFLMIAGTSDSMVDYATNALPTLDRVPTGALVTLWGATHLGFDDIATRWLRPFRNPDRVGCFLGGVDSSAVMKNPFDGMFGTAKQGLLAVSAYTTPCSRTFAVVMRAARQQMLTKVIVQAFFDAQFSVDAAARADSAGFLSRRLPDSLSQVSYSAPAEAASEPASAAAD